MAKASPQVPGEPSPVPRLALRPKEAAAALGISERTLWARTAAGEIPHVRVGQCVTYPVAELQRWLSEQAKGEQARNAKQTRNRRRHG